MKTKLKTLLVVALMCAAVNVSGADGDQAARSILANPSKHSAEAVQWALNWQREAQERAAAANRAALERAKIRREYEAQERQIDMENRLSDLEEENRNLRNERYFRYGQRFNR